MPEDSRTLFDRLLQPILAFRFLTIAVLIHLIFILLFGGQVLFNKYAEPPDFQGVGDDAGSSDAAAQPPETPESTLPPAQSVSVPQAAEPAPGANLAALTTVSPESSSIAMALPPIAPPSIGNEPAPAAMPSTGGPASSLPQPMAQRAGTGRNAAGQKYGERPASEQSVLRALRWLQSQQSTDGTWRTHDWQSALTGLALLCYLGHGETPRTSPEFGVVVNNAINALIKEGTRNEGHFTGSHAFTGDQAVNQHAICTYALSEAYAMTKDDRLPALINQAVDYIVGGQRPDGGWASGYDLRPDDPNKPAKSETSVSGWQILALNAANLTGLPGMDAKVRPVLDLAMKNLDRVFNPMDGSFGERAAGDSNYTVTGVGVLSKLIWFGRPDRTVHKGLKNIISKDLAYTSPDCSLYAWYFDTQACYQAQGIAWDWWKDRFQAQLTGQQSADGSWPPSGGHEFKDWCNSPGGEGAIYRTVFSSLMLEVFYRYLPIDQRFNSDNTIDGL